ncbi:MULTISPECIES: SAM-dependent methyltransferase [unclassified Dysgonomonas]|jgi:16S rRNA G966 N2-methylase RsmD|uniref:THUMP-like domain-containing protein n=1 Tax=unclassified Dysgonomonas TaxID=2630389 RepID=UPI0025C13722|nr:MULTISPECIES: SAM-dependent methyltransferase [unclassified Dysgonomonas]MDR2002818.1 class I SAM-dependent methyltransferase [Prevotella sp.]HMM03439.1 SAM-dependent methyltransferase [Dysgonomonas sp.]
MNLSDELKAFIITHEADDVHSLALQAKQYPDIDMEMAIRQVTGRKIAKEKIPSWYANDNIIYPKHLSMEQCSSEQTALFKASLCGGESMADLTGGLGVDCFFLAHGFNNAVYVEQQSELAEIAVHNFKILGQDIKVVNEDAVSYLSSMPPVNLIYIDPARRDSTGRKTVLIEDCTPNILDIESLLEEKSKQVMIKLSPMLDITLAVKSVKSVSDVYIISVNNECKELLFIKKGNTGKTLYHCVNIQNSNTDTYTFYKEDEDTISLNYTTKIAKYLYEPNASILKAGAYKSIAKAYSLDKLHPSSHLYTSDVLYEDFPGRKFVVDNICSLNKKDMKEYLSDIKQANITTRNFPLSVQEIRKKTGLKDGGDIYIFATTLADDRKVLLICHKA